MDFGFMFYSGLSLLCVACCPPVIALLIMGFLFILSENLKVIALSKKQILILGVLAFVVALVLFCLLVQIPTLNGYRAM